MNGTLDTAIIMRQICKWKINTEGNGCCVHVGQNNTSTTIFTVRQRESGRLSNLMGRNSHAM